MGTCYDPDKLNIESAGSRTIKELRKAISGLLAAAGAGTGICGGEGQNEHQFQ